VKITDIRKNDLHHDNRTREKKVKGELGGRKGEKTIAKENTRSGR
jgi:hypothetical protein